MTKSSRKPLVIIFCTVFFDLIGFGMILPLNPYLAKYFGASSLAVGALSSIYSVTQFLFSPFWGFLSDRYGRRPIILISLLGVSLSYLAFSFADQLWLLFLARGMAGFFGANISTASAYIADITPRENRSKNMGLIGAAFGMGFVLGPVFGGSLGELGYHLFPDNELRALSLASLGAFVFCFCNFLFAIKYLPESLTKEIRLKNQNATKRRRWHSLFQSLRKPVIGSLLSVSFLAIFAMALMESMLFLLVKDRFHFSATKASYAFAYVGIMIAFTQGFLIRRVLPLVGEAKLLLMGLFFMGLGFTLIGQSYSIWMMAIANTVLAIGHGFTMPSILGSLSLLTATDSQGEVLGVNQSVSALGRIVGPVTGGWLFNFGASLPFFAASFFALCAMALVFSAFGRLPQAGRSRA